MSQLTNTANLLSIKYNSISYFMTSKALACGLMIKRISEFLTI